MRKLATIEQIVSVTPIEGADRIEAIGVRGWTCVSGKGNFKVGDLCVYFEVDSALPLEGSLSSNAFSFLAVNPKTFNGKQVHVLKTKRLRGIYSQGLCLPIAEFPQLVDRVINRDTPGNDAIALSVGEDVSELLGVEKYEPPVHASMGNLAPAGNFPTQYIRKTDAERVQNLTGVWDKLRAAKDWAWTEKLDGTSMSVVRGEEGLIVCSRNLALKESDNIYWRMVRKYKLDELLKNVGEFIQGEIIGPGVQGNPLARTENEFYAFDWNIEGGLIRDISEGEAQVHSVPHVALRDLPATVAEIIAEVDGMKSKLNPNKLAEGVVLWNWDDSVANIHALGGRPNFKVISNRYLAKQE